MKPLKATLAITLMIIGLTNCEMSEKDLDFDASGGSDLFNYSVFKDSEKLPKAAGSVEFLWKGGEKGSDMGNQPEDLRAFFNFNFIQGTDIKAPRGEIVYLVTYPDLTFHREIRAQVTGVFIDGTIAWFTGVVISDTKGCTGDGNGGHDSNCSGSSGGCGDDTGGHDGGCSGDGSHEGGCSGSGTDEGGCSEGGSGEEGNGSEGGMGSPGGGDMGNPLSGKNCRLGQVIAGKVHDKGTPGINDGMKWKWFDPDADFDPVIDNIIGFEHLCKKTIIGGNLVVKN